MKLSDVFDYSQIELSDETRRLLDSIEVRESAGGQVIATAEHDGATLLHVATKEQS